MNFLLNARPNSLVPNLQGIPSKGKLLHALSTFWFSLLTPSIIGSHILATDISAFPTELQAKLEPVRDQVEGRSMLVKRAQVIPVEAIVRGYITGSGWKEYAKSGTVHGIKLESGLKESQEIPGGPLFTPSTKAEQGEHDENIHPDKGERLRREKTGRRGPCAHERTSLCAFFFQLVADLVGKELAGKVSKAAVDLYAKAASHARERGIILADTKFEFGLVPSDGSGEAKELILVDEVLTPDSSRFWDVNGYEIGKTPDSYDKQYVREWLKANGLDKAADEGVKVRLPDDVVQRTSEKYKEAYERITGQKWNVGDATGAKKV